MTMRESREWRSSDNAFAVTLPVHVLQELDRLCKEQLEAETGGILVGQYSRDRKTAEVFKAYPPPNDSERGRHWFVRGTLGLAATLARLWKAKSQQYYVGEWHYHPSRDVSPSGKDNDQMRSIAKLNEYQCKDPILIIVGISTPDSSRPISVTVYPDDANRTSLQEYCKTAD